MTTGQYYPWSRAQCLASRWCLADFFQELFNYCFPVDFKIKLRRKLQCCYQNDMSVCEYIYELNEMWNLLGETDERVKVQK
ncbi:hypothetical protein ID866_12408, partial [Astraeus odoratus]